MEQGTGTTHDSFFQNRACPYFPCHATEDPAGFNCLFCYCPLYALGEDCGGDFRYIKNGIKDCSGCLVPHGRDGAKIIAARFPELSRLAAKRAK